MCLILSSLNIGRVQPSNTGIGMEAHFRTCIALAYLRPLRRCVIHMEGVEIYMHYKIDMWQSSVQNEHCSLVYLNHITVLCISEPSLRAGLLLRMCRPLTKVQRCSTLKAVMWSKYVME